MRLKPLLLAALLGAACGGGVSPSAPLSSASTASDGGTSRPDGGPAPAERCDCTGMTLPDICMMCDMGMGMGMGQTMCAHFVCEVGECAVQVCP
jgi:hypothetical protein